MTGSDEHFVNRWSRRKQDSREAPDEPIATEAAPDADPPAEIDPADLPDIDSLDKDSDYTAFMRQGVPEELKNLALRTLWRSDPVLANLDGLNDYDEDFGLALKLGAAEMRKFAEAAKRLEADNSPAEEPEEPGEQDEPDEQDLDNDPAEETDDVISDDPIA